MDPTALSPIAKLLVCAAIALVFTEVVTIAFHLRYYFGRWAVTRWLVKGLDWDRIFVTDRGFLAWVERTIRPWNVIDRAVQLFKSDDEWVTQQEAERPGGVPPPKTPQPSRFDVEARLIALAGGDKSTLYRLTPDHLAAQLNTVASTVLDFPQRNLVLLFALAGQPLARELVTQRVRKAMTAETRLYNVDLSSKDLTAVILEYGLIASFANAIVTQSDIKPTILELRSRIETAIQQRIDVFQTSARSTAALRDQGLYVAAGLLVAGGLLSRPVWSGLRYGVVAGFIAPYFADLRAFLRQPR